MYDDGWVRSRTSRSAEAKLAFDAARCTMSAARKKELRWSYFESARKNADDLPAVTQCAQPKGKVIWYFEKRFRIQEQYLKRKVASSAARLIRRRLRVSIDSQHHPGALRRQNPNPYPIESRWSLLLFVRDRGQPPVELSFISQR